MYIEECTTLTVYTHKHTANYAYLKVQKTYIIPLPHTYTPPQSSWGDSLLCYPHVHSQVPEFIGVSLIERISVCAHISKHGK